MAVPPGIGVYQNKTREDGLIKSQFHALLHLIDVKKMARVFADEAMFTKVERVLMEVDKKKRGGVMPSE